MYTFLLALLIAITASLATKPQKKMKLAKTEEGIRRFSRQHWLTKNQIRSLYGRFAAELKHKTSKPSRDMIENEIAEDERQLRVEIVETIANSVAEPEKLSEQSCPLMVSFIQFQYQTTHLTGMKNISLQLIFQANGFNICELGKNFDLLGLKGRKATIYGMDYKKQITPILQLIGVPLKDIKGKDKKGQAGRKIMVFVKDNCDCIVL